MNLSTGDEFRAAATPSQELLLKLAALADAGSGAVLSAATQDDGNPVRRAGTTDLFTDIMHLLAEQQREELMRALDDQLDRMDEASVRALQDIEDQLSALRRAREKMIEQAYHDEQGRAIFMKADESAAFYEDGAQLDDELFAAIKDQLRGRVTWDDVQANSDAQNALAQERELIHQADADRARLREDLAAGRITPDDAAQRLNELGQALPERVRRDYEGAVSATDNGEPAAIDTSLSGADIAAARIRKSARSLVPTN